MALQSVNAAAVLANPSSLLSLYELDSRYTSPIGERLLFHPGVNGLYQNLVFNAEVYTAFPIDLTDFGTDGKGNIIRPKLRVSNIHGFCSRFLLQQGDLVGARLTRTRVYARFIDAVNFPGGINPFGTPDPSAAYEPDIFFVSRKVSENPQTVEHEIVELEVSSPFELDNVQLPRRPMLATVCPSVYRDGETCGYSGVPVSDRFGKLFAAAIVDGGYGYTLVAKGTWNSSATYAVGDWVTIISQGDFTFGDTLVYVCSQAATTGTTNNPQFNPTNWVPDGCPHNLFGCKAHFPVGALPIGSFAGASRASYQ